MKEAKSTVLAVSLLGVKVTVSFCRFYPQYAFCQHERQRQHHCFYLEHLWVEQCHPTFIPSHPAHRRGMAQFDSSIGMVSRATSTSYPHPANSTVGEYPGFNEVDYHQPPQLSGRLTIGQIYTRMLSGVILPGEQQFNEEHWVNNILNECYFDDCLWGYTIHVVEEL